MQTIADLLLTASPLKFLVQNVWRDEAFSAYVASQPLIELLRISAQDFTPPLHYIALKIWILIAGNSEIALRTPSLVFYVLTGYICYDIFTEFYGMRIRKGLTYMVIVLTTPSILYFGFEARAYAMVAFLCTFSWFLLFKRKNVTYIGVMTAALYTHYFAIFIFIIQMVYIWFVEKRKKTVKIKSAWILGLFAPWVLLVLVLRGFKESGDFWITRPEFTDIFNLPGVLATAYEYGWKFLPNWLGATAIIPELSLLIYGMFVFYFFSIWRKDKKKKSRLEPDIKLIALIVSSVAPGLVVFFGSLIFPTSLYLPRYLIVSIPTMIVAFLVILEFLPRAGRIAALAAFVVLITIYNGYQIKWRGKEDFFRLSTELRQGLSVNDLIYTSSVLDYFVLKYYFPNQTVKLYKVEYAQIPNYVGRAAIAESDTTQILPSYPRRAILIKNSNEFEILAE